MSDKRCTWVGCTEVGTFPQLGKSGVPWAHLCEAHHKRLDETLTGGDARRILSDWVKAKGGAKKAAESM